MALTQRQRLQLHLVVWTLAGALLAVLLRTLFPIAWVSAAVVAMPLALLAAPVSASSWYLARGLPLARTPFVDLAGATAVSAIASAAMWAAVGLGWWRGLGRLGMALPPLASGSLWSTLTAFGALAYLLAIVVTYLLVAYDDAADADERRLRSEIGAREAELRALRAQVDPHFLFNSLNSISGLIAVDPPRAREMTQSLAEFLRESLALGRAERIPLAREVALAARYLQIEHVRFGARLEVATDVASAAAPIGVPPLILQPLVENAVRHGIAGCVDGGAIHVRAEVTASTLAIAVTNPRDPDAGGPRGTGIGLDIVRRRLAAAYGAEAAVVVDAQPTTFRVTLTLPVTHG